MDQTAAKHRMVFDTTTPDGFGHALVFGSNFLDTNKNAYGLEYSDLALMIIVRHNSTPFAYNDMMWSKYGTVFAQKAGFMRSEDEGVAQIQFVQCERLRLDTDE